LQWFKSLVFLGFAALVTAAIAVPTPQPEDSSVGEAAVSAPDGIPMSDVSESKPTESASGTSSADESKMTPAPQYGASYGDSKTWESKSSESKSYSAPTYGSGGSNWGGSGYDDCVQKCMATYGSPPSEYKATATGDGYGSKGTGATYTVIVAPTQGVLRYVPFAVNASVGDTVKFMWGANNHTVTKSSALALCNKTADAPFTSGRQDKDFIFTAQVNDTNPIWFSCGVPGHCAKGMFGVVNPPNAIDATTSVDMMASEMAKNDSDIAAMWSYMKNATKGNDAAAKWGGSFDMKGMDSSSQSEMVMNVMYTRSLLAMNKDIMKDGKVDLSSYDKMPMMLPQDLSSSLNAAASGGSSSAAASSTASTATAAPSASTSATSAGAISNGATSLASPRVLVAFMAIVTTLFAL
jgi:plastocyanin